MQTKKKSKKGVFAREVQEIPEKAILLDVHDVAKLLHCSARHVYRMSDTGKLPRPLKLGSLTRWSRSSIEQFVERQSKISEKRR